MQRGAWAEREFGAAELGDKRRTRRLVALATQRARQPTAAFSQAGWAAAKAAYRFFDNPAITPEAILAPHRQATLARLRGHPVILLPQDTTQLDYSTHTDVVGLGALQTAQQRGLLLHTTLAVTPDRVPLGVLDQQVWARDPAAFGKRQQRRQRPIDQKESRKWLDSLARALRLQAQRPGVQLVSVADREGDVYDFLQPALMDGGGPAVLVRAAWDRAVHEPEQHLRAHMASQPVAGSLTVNVPRRPGQPARLAQVRIRFAPVRLRPPRARRGEGLPSLALWAVRAHEDAPPPGVTGLDWLLLSNLPVTDFAQACKRVAWYSCRWVVELYHKVLKSGCRIEARQLEHVDNLKRYLALDGVVAWQVLYATLVGRAQPELSCTALLEAYEWQALYCFVHQVATPPTTPPSLAQAVRWIAGLGGYLGRKGDGPPGVTTLWRGFQRLHDIAAAWQLAHADVGND